MPRESIAEMRDAGLFRILQPARYGGYEFDFSTLTRVSMELASACASTAWVGGLAVIHQWLMASFPIEAQDEVWGNDPSAIAFGSYAAVTQARPVDGGYRISGSWPFSSGCDHANWGILGVFFPPAAEADRPSPGLMLVPRAEFGIEDDWHTVGLAATGSKRIVCDDVFVPAHRGLAFSQFVDGGSPGSTAHANPVYGIPPLAVIPTTLTAPALGALRGAIEDFISDSGARITRGAVVSGGQKLAEFAGVQSRVAEAAAALDAGTLMTLRDLDEACRTVRAGEPVSIDMRIRNRLTHAYSVRLAVDAINGLYAATGGAGIYVSGRIQRAWRDINAISHHVSLNWDAVSTMYGQRALGLEPRGQY